MENFVTCLPSEIQIYHMILLVSHPGNPKVRAKMAVEFFSQLNISSVGSDHKVTLELSTSF